MKRREFLKVAALGTAAAVSAADSGAQPAPIRAGFLGIGHSHGPGKYQALAANHDFNLAGICDPTPEGREAIRRLGAREMEEGKLLEECELVVVESPVRDLARLAAIALRAGRHVHVEKPPTRTLAEMRELVDLARARDRVLQTGYMWRYNPGFTTLFEAVQNGWLGEIYQARGRMNTLLPEDRRAEWAEFPGGATFEQGCHLIDAMVRLLGRPRRVIPHLRRSARVEDNLMDNNVVLLEFDRATGIVTNSTLQPNAFPHRCFELTGSNGVALLQPLEPPALRLDLVRAAGPWPAGTTHPELPPYRRYEADFKELARAIRGQGKLTATLDQELIVQETVLAASEML